MKMNDFYFLDTFAGMAGLRIGVEQSLLANGANPVCVGTAEIKTHALKTLRHIYPDEDFPFTDITKLDTDDIPHIDGLIGGFPCQTFSYSGIRAGLDDTRGTLFYELARIMEAKKPRWALFENVNALYSFDKGRTFETILNTFEDLGYKTSYALIDSKDHGLANVRPRVFIVCHRDYKVDMEFDKQDEVPFTNIKEIHPVDESDYTKRLLETYNVDELRGMSIRGKRKGPSCIKPWNFNARGYTTKRQRDIMDSIVNFQDSKRFNPAGKTVPITHIKDEFDGDVLDDLHKLEDMKYIREHNGGYRSVFGQLSGTFTWIIDEARPFPTLTATDARKKGIIEGDGLRSITVSEALKGLGFPDDYAFPDDLTIGNKFDLLGNTVSPPVIKMIVDRILETEKMNDN